MANPVIINVSSPKNYSQVVPKSDFNLYVTIENELKYCLDVETTTLCSAVIIPFLSCESS